MEIKARRRIHILSITSAPCQICNQSEPWTHRVRIEFLPTNTFSADEILCPLCIQIESQKEDTTLYDSLRDRTLFPSEILSK